MFSCCDLAESYDFFIFSGNWAHYAARKHRPNLWYCHTPVRVFYDLKKDMISRQTNALLKFAASTWIECHKRFDQRSVQHIDRIVANSLNVQKRIDLQFEAFRRLPQEKLVIVGGYARGDHAAKYHERLREVITAAQSQ